MYWYIEGDSQLSVNALSLIQDQSNDIEISPASYWEIAIKVSIGKWKLNRPYEDFLDIGLNQYGFQVLPIHHNHTARLIGLPFHHNDPFDRLLVAQSLVQGLRITNRLYSSRPVDFVKGSAL